MLAVIGFALALHAGPLRPFVLQRHLSLARCSSLPVMLSVNEARSVLGVSATASRSDIRRAFKRRAFETHPDRSAAPDAAARFQTTVDAVDLLLDKPGSRRRFTRQPPSADARWRGRTYGHTGSADANYREYRYEAQNREYEYRYEARSRAQPTESCSQVETIARWALVVLYITGQYAAWALFLHAVANLQQ